MIKAVQNRYMILIFLGYIVLSIVVLKGGYFNPEANTFFRRFLDDRPFLVKIFDAERVYSTGYQAREFSYIFDFIDEHFILLSAKIGIVHFLSLTHYLSVLTITGVVLYISKVYFKQIHLSASFLLSLLYLTSPGPLLTANLFRSAKILVALFIILLFFFLLLYVTQKIKQNKLLPIISLFTFLMAISDKQGTFFAFVFTAISLFLLILYRNRAFLKLVYAFVIGSLLYTFYSDILAPWLITYFSGQSPAFLQTSNFAGYVPVIQNHLLKAIMYVLDQFSFFFGGLGGTIFGLILILSLFGFWVLTVTKYNRNNDQLPSVREISIFIPFLLLSCIPLTSLLLIYESTFLFWPSIKPIYYNLPLATIIFLFSSLILARFLSIWPRYKMILLTALSLLLVFNLASIPKHYSDIANGVLKDTSFVTTPELKRCIRERNIPQKTFTRLKYDQQANGACTFLRKRLGR